MAYMHVLVNSRFAENPSTRSWLTPSSHDGGVTKILAVEIEVITTTKYQLILGGDLVEQDSSGGSEPPLVDQRSPTSVLLEHHLPTPTPVDLASPSSVESDLDYDHDEDAPLRFRRIDNVFRPTAVPSLTERVV
jgi:hypothetical protein